MNKDREAGRATDQVVDQAATSTQTEAGLAVELAPSPTAKKTKILLSPSDNEKLLSDMQELRQYYTESISLHRSGNVLAPSTLQTMERRILTFLGFVKLQKPDLPVDLRAVLNLSALKEFLNFMKDERKSKHGNLQVYAQSFIKCLKFLQAPSDTIQTVRGWSNSFQKDAQINREKSWNTLAANGRWLSWKTILETVKCQREAFEAADGSVAIAWEAVKLSVLLMYTSLPPGRSLEYFTMQFQYDAGDLHAIEPAKKESNWLFFATDLRSALLYIGAHKTSRSIGVQKIQLSAEDETCTLLEHLVEYVSKHRPILITNKTHQFLFVNRSGDPFANSNAWTSLLNGIFHHYTGASISTNVLRSAYVTHVMSGEQSAAINMSNLATSMRHSVIWEQQRTYDRRSSGEKISAVVHTVANELNSVLGVESHTGGQVKAADCDQIQAEECEYCPAIGDIVAVVETSSTVQTPVIILGKVLRVFPKEQEEEWRILTTSAGKFVCLDNILLYNARETVFMHLRKNRTAWLLLASSVFPIDCRSGSHETRTFSTLVDIFKVTLCSKP
ncbi:hypothetical protein EMCRGX_G032000 [Ephydatia muelleri]